MGQIQVLDQESFYSVLKAEGLAFSSEALISFQGDSNFDKATQHWNAYHGPSFSACITVASEEDVVQAVLLDVGFLATASRHAYGMTMSRLKNGLAIDLSLLNSIHINDSVATIGPGATTDQVMNAVDKAGFQIPVPSHGSLSVTGVTIGGGVNRWSGVYGLVLDTLITARVVLHNGKIVNVSESENSDLFWGLRGAGANFGIIISARYQLQEPINNGEVFSADILYSINQSKSLFNTLSLLTEDQPPELSIVLYIAFSAAISQPVIIVNCTWHGISEMGLSVVQPLLSLETISANARPIRWTEVISTDPGLRLKDLSRVIGGVNLRKFDVATFQSTVDKLAWLYNEIPAARGSTFLAEWFPMDPIKRADDGATAYPWRDATCNLMIQMSWLGSDDVAETAAKALGKELREAHTQTSGYSGLSVYVNYAFGNEHLEEMYGERQLPRLLQLKALWDPDNVFRYHHPLVQE